MANFFWYDVMARDLAQASLFYDNVMKWNAAPAGIGDAPYIVFSAGDVDVAGLMDMPESVPASYGSIWTGYIHVTDVDEMAKRIQSAGGKICREAWNVPSVGRMLLAEDPEGAKFLIMSPFSNLPRPTVAGGTVGHVGWHELHSSNWQTAYTFYAELFEWKKTEALDMGPMGIYQMFATESEAIGGMMNNQSADNASYWMYYFNVDSVESCIARITEHGGSITLDPRQVPGGQWIAQAQDPQGAIFGISSPTK